MKKQQDVTTEKFARFLAWLNADEEFAAQKYLEIRHRLEMYFAARRHQDPEELTSETINRVIVRVYDWADNETLEPLPICYGVAYNVHREQLRKPKFEELADEITITENEDKEKIYHILERCLQHLTPEKAHLLLAYYEDSRRLRIDHRRELAQQFNLSENALRIQVYRLRQEIETCVRKQLQSQKY